MDRIEVNNRMDGRRQAMDVIVTDISTYHPLVLRNTISRR